MRVHMLRNMCGKVRMKPKSPLRLETIAQLICAKRKKERKKITIKNHNESLLDTQSKSFCKKFVSCIQMWLARVEGEIVRGDQNL